MISLGDDWLLQDSDIYHACGPELRHRWTGGCVCECGSAVPQRVESFHRWLCEQQTRAKASRGEDGPVTRRRAPRLNWQWQPPEA